MQRKNSNSEGKLKIIKIVCIFNLFCIIFISTKKEKPMDYRDEIYKLRLERTKIASKLQLGYGALSRRLSGSLKWRGDEEKQLQAIIKEAKGKK
jgi:hypothetical protein